MKTNYKRAFNYHKSNENCDVIHSSVRKFQSSGSKRF